MSQENNGVEIPGLSPLQIDLANRIWSMDSTEEIMAFFNELPRSLKVEAYVVYQMILLAYIDQEPMADFAEAQEVIDYVRNLPC